MTKNSSGRKAGKFPNCVGIRRVHLIPFGSEARASPYSITYSDKKGHRLLNSLSALTCAKIKMSKNENDPTVVTENNLVLSKVENASADYENDSIRLQKRTRIRSIFSMLSGKNI